MRGRWAAGLIAGLSLLAEQAAAESYATVISPKTSVPAWGNVVRGASNTLLTVSPSNEITVTGGVRLSIGGVNVPQVSITCSNGAGGNCKNDVLVTISAVGGTTAKFTAFSVGGLSCSPGCTATFSPAAPSGTAPLSFRIQGVGNGKTATFKIGSTTTVLNSGSTGNQSFGLSVSAVAP